jgi:hypothetical protein
MEHMAPEARIPAAQIVNDIRAGVSDVQLMKKYELPSGLLWQVLKELVELKAIRAEEISGRVPDVADEVVLENIEPFVLSMRELPRHYVDFPTIVYEVKRPDNRGRLHDINEKGVGMRGVTAALYEVKTFVVMPSGSRDFEPVVFEAECRWARQETDGHWAAGFRITHISDRELQELRRLIRLIWFGS